jgi:microcystin-dependent protein
METKHIIIGLLILLVVLFLMQNKEHAGSTQPLSNEAVQNIAKVYADTSNTATFNNVRITGGITGSLNVDGNVNFLPVASIIMFAWPDEAIPNGWAKCDGGTYMMQNNKTTKVALGTPGAINTPDLRGRFPIGVGAGPGLTPRSEWEKGGAETHTLTVEQMPPHNHTTNISRNGKGHCDEAGPNVFECGGGGGDYGYNGLTLSNTGGGQPHPIMPPFTGVNFIMRIV